MPTVIGTYAVKTGCIDRLLEVLADAGEENSRLLPGFIAATVYVSEGDKKVVSCLELSADGNADVLQPDIVNAALREGLVEWAEQAVFDQRLGKQASSPPELETRLLDLRASFERGDHWRTAP